MYLACTSEDSFRLAAQKGIGVLSSASYAVEVLKDKVNIYRDALKDSEPAGAFVTNFWGNNVHGFCEQRRPVCEGTRRRVHEDLLRPRQAVHPRAHRRV